MEVWDDNCKTRMVLKKEVHWLGGEYQNLAGGSLPCRSYGCPTDPALHLLLVHRGHRHHHRDLAGLSPGGYGGCNVEPEKR